MTEYKNANNVKVLKTVGVITPIESGMNVPTDNERSKKKITTPLY